jgi:uncharacterized protein
MATILLAGFAYIAIGLTVGLLSGLLGVGGGIIMVPCLTIVLAYQHVPWSVLLPIVAATSLAVIALTSSFSFFHYKRRGYEIWDVYSQLLGGLLFGVFLGVSISVSLHPSLLRVMFGVFLLVVAILLFLPWEPQSKRHLPGRVGMSSIFFLVGFKSGLFGVGGGLITTPYLLYCNVPARRAFAIACASSATIAIAGVACFFVLSAVTSPTLPAYTWGYVYWPAFFGIALVSPWSARYGVRWAHRFSVTTLRRFLACFIVLAGIDMLIH